MDKNLAGGGPREAKPLGRGWRGNKGGRGRGTASSPNSSNLPQIPKDILDNMARKGPKSKKQPEGQDICRNFLFGNCWGKCGRSHGVCPRKLPSGSFCFKNHTITKCLKETPL